MPKVSCLVCRPRKCNSMTLAWRCVFAFAVRKPNAPTVVSNAGSTVGPPQIVHPPHLYTNTAATVIHPAAYPDTATYVNVVSQRPPPFYHHPPPLIRPQAQPHPSSSGHVPYSPAFQSHQQHVRPVGIAMPRQGNSDSGAAYQRQSSIGSDARAFHY